MVTIFARSEQFIRDLNRVSATLASSQNIECFLNDLARVYHNTWDDHKTVFPVVSRTLAELADVFKEIKAGVLERLEGPNWLEKLPASDPLRCGIGLFDTLDFGLRETAHTHRLAWLMDPDGNHGFRNMLLLVFLKNVFGLDIEPKLFDVHIEDESRISDSRGRLDIHMRGAWKLPGGKVERWLVILEAKIDASEGEYQCGKYEELFHKEIVSADRHRLVFLTREGRQPKTGIAPGGVKWTPKVGQRGTVFINQIGTVQHVQKTTPA